MYNYVVKSGKPFIILTNKADKIAVTKVNNALSDIQKVLNPLNDFTFLPFSSERKIYTETVWENIENILEI